MSSKDRKHKKQHNKDKGGHQKKSKNKHEKKKKGLKTEKSSTKLHRASSHANLKKKESKHIIQKIKETMEVSTGDALNVSTSDTCVNMFTEQSSTPTQMKTSTPLPMATSPTPTAIPIPYVPPPATVIPTISAPMKWKAEEVALGYIEKLDSTMARLEYIEICASTKANVEKDCQLWTKNLQKNQSDIYPILDSNIIKIQNQPEDYVNMSSIVVPHCRYPILMAQMPKRGLEEEFWKATFHESVLMLYVLMGTEDEKNDFFPTTMGAFVYYGNMFVNVRKVEKMDEERTRYTLEVLPNGFSNSNLVNVYVHTGWEPQSVPCKYANTTRSVVDVMNFVKTSDGKEKMMIVSRNGCGRAGFFLSLGAAFCCLNDNSEPRIGEIVKAIRMQRPNAVESMKQYASLYLGLLYYIKKKTMIPDTLKQKLEDVTKSFEGIIREDLSIMY